jgi:hypothetical protein
MDEQQIAQRVVELQKELDAQPDQEALMRSVMEGAQAREVLVVRTSVLRSVPSQLRSLDAKLKSETEWLDQLRTWRETLRSEVKPLSAHPTERELGVYENLQLSLSACDTGALGGRDLESLRLGELMRLSGVQEGPKYGNQQFGKLPWFGSLRDVTLRVKHLQDQKAHLQAQLDEALLTDAERAAHAAERVKAVDAERTGPRRKTRGLTNDGKCESTYEEYPDGHVEEVQSGDIA